jgi:gluconate 5-dehydrogenase
VNVRFDFSGEHAIVTGGSRGIGLSVARMLANSGAMVTVLDSDPRDLNNELTVDSLARVRSIACDVSDEAAVIAAVATASASAPVGLLVNNAGTSRHAAPETYPLDDWRVVIDVNLTSTFLLSREVARRAIIAGTSASIVNLSSIAGQTALGRGIFAYGAAKAGIEQLTRDFAVEWASHGIRVNSVAPCQVATRGYAGVRTSVSETAGEDIQARALAGIPIGRLAQPDDIASAILFLLSSEAAMITGAVLNVDGGNLALNAGGSPRIRKLSPGREAVDGTD